MKRLKKILKYTGIVVLILIIGIFIFLFAISPGSTPSFKDKHGEIIVNSIAKMEYLKIGGVEQFILIRGKSKDNPILLFLHGGPGVPELPMFRNHNRELENYFTVVYWDQRGCGKSANPNIPESSFSIDQFIADTHELTGYLKSEFRKQKIFILGHSWGSLLGMKTIAKYPKDYYAFVGTGQVGNQPKSDSLSFQFVLKIATEKNDTVALRDLNKIGQYSNENLKKSGVINWLFVQRAYVSKFNGALYNPNSDGDVFVNPILFCREYTIADKYNLIKSNTESGFKESSVRNMFPDVLKTNLCEINDVQIPVFFLQGKNDHLTDFSVAKEYFDLLRAPRKVFVSFDKSAHFVPYEEPEKFNGYMINCVLKECLR